MGTGVAKAAPVLFWMKKVIKFYRRNDNKKERKPLKYQRFPLSISNAEKGTHLMTRLYRNSAFTRVSGDL